jgi:DNA-binding PadR family transcriptional regulator
LLTHDDWDCLDDLEADGFLEVINLTQGVVKLTPAGLVVAAQLRAHKAHGGQFAQSILQPSESPSPTSTLSQKDLVPETA